MWKYVCLALLTLASTLHGQSACATCKGTGAVACKRCPLVHERADVLCSVAFACAQCRGANRVSCPKCHHASSDKSILARRSLVRNWLESRRNDLLKAAENEKGRLRAAMHCRTPNLDLVFAPAKIESGPSSDSHLLMHIYARRIEDTRRSFVETLGLKAADFPALPVYVKTVAWPAGRVLPSPRLYVLVQQRASDHRRVCPNATGLVHQGVGVKRLGDAMVYAMHHDVADLRDDAALHRNLAHNVVHLLLSNIVPTGWIGERGHGWLDGGLAHYFEARAGGGICANSCYHERAQAPLKFRRGKWLDAAKAMASDGTLPRIALVFGKDLADLTPEEHVVSFALVSYCISEHSGPHVGRLVREIKRGTAVTIALKNVFGFGVVELENKLRTWLVGKPVQLAASESARAPHVALYIYTRPFVRARHRNVIQKALARRAEAHTSGWRIEKGKPVIALGPVSGSGVRHWRKDKVVTSTGKAWPFAAVLEYEPTAGNQAFLDWFRRKRGSKDVGAWFLDPPGTYVMHINAETVCDQDSRYCYMAVVDTPTGDAITSNEFAVRGRVVDAKGNATRRGWWVRFGTSRRRSSRDWAAKLVPLVDWRIDGTQRGGGATTSARMKLPSRELAVWGTKTVFRFPSIPGGIRPCTPKK
jgi:hypothetical protein